MRRRRQSVSRRKALVYFLMARRKASAMTGLVKPTAPGAGRTLLPLPLLGALFSAVLRLLSVLLTALAALLLLLFSALLLLLAPLFLLPAPFPAALALADFAFALSPCFISNPRMDMVSPLSR